MSYTNGLYWLTLNRVDSCCNQLTVYIGWY